MSTHNDIEWRNQNNERLCLANALIVGPYAKSFVLGHLVIPRTKFRNEVERGRHFQAWRRMGQSRRTHDEEPQ